MPSAGIPWVAPRLHRRQPSVAVLSQKGDRQRLRSGRGGRKQRDGSALDSQRGLFLGCQSSERGRRNL